MTVDVVGGGTVVWVNFMSSVTAEVLVSVVESFRSCVRSEKRDAVDEETASIG